MPHVNKQMISFFLTTKCNLRCIYCYNSKERQRKTEQTLNFDFAKVGIDYFFKYNSSRHIRFYGPGEPTQKFTLLKQVTEYARSLADSNVTTEVQTNGVFGSEVRDWFSGNVNVIWFSFDGPPDIQDFNRPVGELKKPSSVIIEKNVRYLTEHCKDNNVVGVRVTMSDKNIKRQIEMINYFSKLGVKYIWTDPLFPSVDECPFCEDPDKQKEYSFDMDGYIDEFIPAYHYAKNIGIFYNTFLMANFDGESSYNCRACTPTPHLTPDGYISACDLVTFGANAHHMQPFIIGEWDRGNNTLKFYDDKVSNLQNRKVENIAHCKECNASHHCGGYCLGEVLNESGSLLGQKPKTCAAIKRLAREIGFSYEPYPFFHP